MARTNTTRSVGESIRRAMKAQGLSQNDVARRAGISQATVGRIIKGKNSATMDTLEPIAAALGVSVADITAGAGLSEPVVSQISERRTEAERMAHLSQMYAACDDGAKEILVAVAERLANSRPRKKR